MKIYYHSWLANKVGNASEEIDLSDDVLTVSELLDWLEQKDDKYKDAFSNRNVIYASVNNEVIEHDQKVSDVKELTLFSPIAGG